MEIEFLAWFENVLSIENLNEKWGQRKYRFKISNFYLYCMTILIYFLQPFLVIQSWWRKVPTAAACCSLWPFQEATCKNRPGFNWQTDRAAVRCQISSWVSYKAGYELTGPDIPRNRSAMKERRELVGGLWSVLAVTIWTCSRMGRLWLSLATSNLLSRLYRRV